jgi:hypothetical protein
LVRRLKVLLSPPAEQDFFNFFLYTYGQGRDNNGIVQKQQRREAPEIRAPGLADGKA